MGNVAYVKADCQTLIAQISFHAFFELGGNMNRAEFDKKFFEERDHTGRYMVRSQKTGYAYYIEPLDKGTRRDFGDINPATGKVEGAYGSKYKGAIHPSESLITEENGFQNIKILPPGVSPHQYINTVDDQRYEDMLAGRESDPTLPGIKT